MITRFSVRNFKALRDVSLELTPVHVLIGPNDSGKTSILEAIAALCRSVDTPVLSQAFEGRWEGSELVWGHDPHLEVSFEAEISPQARKPCLRYRVTCQFNSQGRESRVIEEQIKRLPDGPDVNQGPDSATWIRRVMAGAPSPSDNYKLASEIHDALSGVQIYGWDPDQLRLPVGLKSQSRFRMTRSGFGLPRVLDEILGDDRERFSRLEGRFKKLFPEVESIKLRTEPAYQDHGGVGDPAILQRVEGKGIAFVLSRSRVTIPASQASDGTILALAYLAVLHVPRPPRVLLIEEPENGVHPKRLETVVEILREIVGEQDHSQVVLATHSPYILDFFEPREVTICRKNRNGEGTVHRLSESDVVRRQSQVFTLGEIWTAEGEEQLTQRAEGAEK
jgi:ABC-type branched-subunit amino acid transport system ATPase component